MQVIEQIGIVKNAQHNIINIINAISLMFYCQPLDKKKGIRNKVQGRQYQQSIRDYNRSIPCYYGESFNIRNQYLL